MQVGISQQQMTYDSLMTHSNKMALIIRLEYSKMHEDIIRKLIRVRSMEYSLVG